MEKPCKGPLTIPGTVVNGPNAQLLISSGIHALDTILGGGIPVGTVAIIEEDMHGSHARVMLDYFLAEGIVSNHSTLIASLDVNPHNIIKGLPAVIHSDPESNNISKPNSNNNNNNNNIENDKMTIAFRYQNLPKKSKDEEQINSIGHYYDLSKTISLNDIENSDILYWNCHRIVNDSNNTFINPAYNELLKSIKNKIKDGKFFLKDPTTSKRTILRIGIHSLGSPMWLPQKQQSFQMIANDSRDLDMFIFCLRALVRSAYAVAVITIPTHLYHENSLDRCIHSSDIAMRLQTFSGTELENNFSLSDYHGFFHLTKLAAINSFASKHPGAVEYVFKLKRKKFEIEKLHLPPAIQESNDRTTPPTLGCGGSNKHLLEF